MSVNRGKAFEDVVKGAFESVPNTHVKRLYDVQGGYAGVANECDFYIFRSPIQYLIECKSTNDDRLTIFSPNPKRKYGDISNTQWEGMLEAAKTKNVVAGVMCWWVKRDVTKFMPIQALQYLRDVKGMKSIRYDFDPDFITIDDFITIEGTKKRVFFDYDMQKFIDFYENLC